MNLQPFEKYSSPPLRNEKPRILVVDDNPSIRQMLELGLSEYFQIHSVPDGGHLFELINSLAPQLLILDLQLPGENGHVLCQKIKQSQHLKRLKILIMTARHDNVSFLSSLYEGADGFISKPFERRELMEKISALLNL